MWGVKILHEQKSGFKLLLAKDISKTKNHFEVFKIYKHALCSI